MRKQKLPSMEWIKARTEWRIKVVKQIKDWVEKNRQGPYDRVMHNVIIRRASELEMFMSCHFEETPPKPFAADDAAALIVAPRALALRLSRSLFGGGTGVAKDLQSEDIARFNMDWFKPRTWDLHRDVLEGLEEITYRGWTIEPYEGTQVGYTTHGRGYTSFGKGRKVHGYVINYPEGGSKFVNTLKEAKKCIDEYLGE
jgi:hypothetical protein